MNEPTVQLATVRDGDGEWHIECRFSDGQKCAAIVVDREFPELAERIVAFLSISSRALDLILAERRRQDELWGEQNHDPITYLAILTEEVGELAKAAIEARFNRASEDDIKTEAVQAAAVALAIVECLERGRWHDPLQYQEAWLDIKKLSVPTEGQKGLWGDALILGRDIRRIATNHRLE